MRPEIEIDEAMQPIYLANQRVPPGTYRRLHTGQYIRLEQEDVLPASLDGQIACYIAAVPTWAEMAMFAHVGGNDENQNTRSRRGIGHSVAHSERYGDSGLPSAVDSSTEPKPHPRRRSCARTGRRTSARY